MNHVSESILPKSWGWGYSVMDPIQFKAVYKRFGHVAWKSYVLFSLPEYCIYYGPLQFFKKCT